MVCFETMFALTLLMGTVGCSGELASPGALEPAVAPAVVQASASPMRDGAFALAGSTVRGDLHVFVTAPAKRVEHVAYFLDGIPVRIARNEPFDMMGVAASGALPFDTASLADGDHRLVVDIVPRKGAVQSVTADFAVRNGAGPGPEPEAPSDEPDPTDPPPATEPDSTDGGGDDAGEGDTPPPSDEETPSDEEDEEDEEAPSDEETGSDEESPSGDAIWQPRPGTSWQWQLQGPIDTSVDADVYDIDLFDAPQSVIDELHAEGRRVICYFSAGSYEGWRPDAHLFPDAVRGKKMSGWDEDWLDVRRIDLLAPIMRGRLDLAAEKGCDAVEPDNVDGYANATGFPLTYADQLAYNTFLADEAHARGLAIGLKNDLDQVRDLVHVFDFAVNEECYQWNECDMLTPFVQAGKAVFGAEYGVPTSEFCPVTNRLDLDFILKEMDLGVHRVSCR